MERTEDKTPKVEAKPIELAPPVTLVRLDLGAGQNPAEGYESVDLNASANHKVDLFKFPWPWLDESVDALRASHFVEHIPAREVELRDLDVDTPHTRGQFIGQDMLFAFFDECHRILKPKGTFEIIVPCLESSRAFQDPTHRRFITQATFCYLNKGWRESQKLDHYRVKCNFDGPVEFTVMEELTLLHQEVAQRRIREGWNTRGDYIAKLFKI